MQECRAKFPQPLSEEDYFENENRVVKFIPKHNDQQMGRYNDFVIQTRRANIDFNIVTSVELIINYIAKYVTKCEVSSIDFNSLVAKISQDLGENSPGTALIRKIIQASLSGRDYSAQEVCHILMGWPLYEASRSFVNLNLSERVLIRLSEGGERDNNDRVNTKLIEFYRSRPSSEKLCLFDYAKFKEVVRGNLRDRKKNM